MTAPRRAAAVALLAALAVASPVLAGLAYTAAGAAGVAGVGATGLTGGRLERVLADPAVWASLGWTVRAAVLSTALATGLAVAVAVTFRGTRRADRRVDRLAGALAVVPLPIPQVVAASCAVLVLAQSGLLARAGHALRLVATPQDMPALVYDRFGAAMVLALAWKEFPFLFLVASSLLATQGEPLEEVARTHGAGAWDTFRRVTWPLLWRGLLPSAVAVFAFVAGSYEAAALLGPSDPRPFPVLTLERYADPDLARRGDAYVLTLLGLLLGAAAVAAHELARARQTRVSP